MKDLIWRLQAAAFYLFTLFVASLPYSQSLRIGRNTGRFLYNVFHSRREVVLDNINKALPFMQKHPAWSGEFSTAEEIARATFMNLGVSIVEVCRLYHGKGDMLIDSIDVSGAENFQQARLKEKGLILVSGHCGNWELISLSFKRLFGENVWAVARHQNNPYLHRVVEEMRMSYGNKIIYNKSALRPILSVIKQNGVIGMLTDQAVSEDNGALVEFLGRTAWANRAPAIIAHKTGVPLVPVFSYRSGNHHTLTIHPEYTLCGDRSDAGINRDIQELSRYLEEFVCAHPADWYWLHRRWKRAGEPI